MVEKGTNYAVLRSLWTVEHRAWKLTEGPNRTATHDVLINHLNMLARYLKRLGKTAAWREVLDYVEEDPRKRRWIGDFGCYLAFVHVLNGR